MWEKIIDGVLTGSPWAIVCVLGFVIWWRERQKRKDILSLVGDKDEIQKELNDELRELNTKTEELMDKHQTKVENLQEKRLAECVDFNNQFNSAVRQTAESLKTLTEVIKAQRGTA